MVAELVSTQLVDRVTGDFVSSLSDAEVGGEYSFVFTYSEDVTAPGGISVYTNEGYTLVDTNVGATAEVLGNLIFIDFTLADNDQDKLSYTFTIFESVYDLATGDPVPTTTMTITGEDGVTPVFTTMGATPQIVTGDGDTASVSIDENTTFVMDINATDEDVTLDPSTLTYSISGGDDAARFTIDAETGELSFISAPNFEAPTDSGPDNVYEVEVTVTDNVGKTDTQAISVTVENANDPAKNQFIILASYSGNEGDTLSISAAGSGIDEDGLGGFSAAPFQWYRNGIAIDDAVGFRYQLTQADVGTEITVSRTWLDGSGFTETVTSDPVTGIQNVNDDPTGAVVIQGTARTGEALTADTSTIADEDGLGAFSYQWFADGVEIAGATDAAFTLTTDQVGAEITVTVSYTDAFLYDESLTSAATTAVRFGDLDLVGDGGPDRIKGHYGDDRIAGKGGDDILIGGRGADTLLGGIGDDELRGGKGNDTLKGGPGRDILIGGNGNDTLTGGKGGDIFLFTQSSGNDTITDFGRGHDLIQIRSGASYIEDLDFSQNGSDVVISFANSTITVENKTVDEMYDISNFLFL